MSADFGLESLVWYGLNLIILCSLICEVSWMTQSFQDYSKSSWYSANILSSLIISVHAGLTFICQHLCLFAKEFSLATYSYYVHSEAEGGTS